MRKSYLITTIKMLNKILKWFNMKNLIYPVAVLAVVSMGFSIGGGIEARDYERKANLTNQLIMLIYPLHLRELEIGLENEESFEKIMDLVGEYNGYEIESIRSEQKERYWQSSSQTFIITLMLIFVSFSIKGKQKELKFWIRGTLVITLMIALWMFFNPFLI